MFYDYIKMTPIKTKTQKPKGDWWDKFEKILYLILI